MLTPNDISAIVPFASFDNLDVDGGYKEKI